MRKSITYIDAKVFDDMITELAGPLALKAYVQKGFVKVQAPNGLAMYFASTKTVGRIDLSGWSVGGTPPEGTEPDGFTAGKIGDSENGVEGLDGDVHAPHDGQFGNVSQQVNFGLAGGPRPVEAIVATVRRLLAHMASLPPQAKKAKKAPAHKAGSPSSQGAEGWKSIDVEGAKAERIARLKARKEALDAAKAAASSPPAEQALPEVIFAAEPAAEGEQQPQA